MFAYNTEREYTDFIVELVRMLGCQTYLELGVSEAKNIHAVVPYCPRCIGVDVLDLRHYRDFEFYLLPTYKFFKIFIDKADIIFIDSNHDFEYVRQDLASSLELLNKHGIILMHDTDPIDVKYTAHKYCSDAFRIVNFIREFYPELDILTLPVSVAGLTMVKRKEDRRFGDG